MARSAAMDAFDSASPQRNRLLWLLNAAVALYMGSCVYVICLYGEWGLLAGRSTALGLPPAAFMLRPGPLFLIITRHSHQVPVVHGVRLAAGVGHGLYPGRVCVPHVFLAAEVRHEAAYVTTRPTCTMLECGGLAHIDGPVVWCCAVQC